MAEQKPDILYVYPDQDEVPDYKCSAYFHPQHTDSKEVIFIEKSAYDHLEYEIELQKIAHVVLIKQRDSLQAEVEKLKQPNIYTNPMAADAFKMGHQACEKIVLPMITKERDELRAEVETWKANALHGPGGKIIQDNLDMLNELSELNLLAESYRAKLAEIGRAKLGVNTFATDDYHRGYFDAAFKLAEEARKALEGK